ncbi:hypothetical protein [Mycobacterium stomatepiae]|uniref:hypothetical protein n=1 Tax=Mycobacterium stomatepiae TaxID=470076 RepID=UPI0021F2C3E8|nr:hypothetical protein [Mycobacterium stomatepiae]MCV7166558.1 hypothetical protein [Mycobacterium stomatepiae]
MVRAPAGSEDIRAEVAELVGIGVGAVQPADSLTCQDLTSVRTLSLADRSGLVAAGSAAAAGGADVSSNVARALSEHHDIP